MEVSLCCMRGYSTEMGGQVEGEWRSCQWSVVSGQKGEGRFWGENGRWPSGGGGWPCSVFGVEIGVGEEE